MTTQQPEPQPEPPELESEIDESELRRELLNDVSENGLQNKVQSLRVCE
jgi:hypothetical protein